MDHQCVCTNTAPAVVVARLAPAYGNDPAAALTAAYAAVCGCPTHPRAVIVPYRDRCPVTLNEPWRKTWEQTRSPGKREGTIVFG